MTNDVYNYRIMHEAFQWDAYGVRGYGHWDMWDFWLDIYFDYRTRWTVVVKRRSYTEFIGEYHAEHANALPDIFNEIRQRAIKDNEDNEANFSS